jgi:hypothetical protein
MTGEQVAIMAVADMGRALGAPWGVDHKKAALLAWLLLRRGESTRDVRGGLQQPASVI